MPKCSDDSDLWEGIAMVTVALSCPVETGEEKCGREKINKPLLLKRGILVRIKRK